MRSSFALIPQLALPNHGSISLLLTPSSYKHPSRWVWIDVFVRIQVTRPALALGILEVVTQYQMAKYHLDLLACIKAAGTGVFAVSKMKIVAIGHRKLVAVDIFGVRWVFTQTYPSKRIKVNIAPREVLGVIENRV